MKLCSIFSVGLTATFCMLTSPSLAASGFSMEAMTVQGEVSYGTSINETRPMQEGNLIPPGYVIVVKEKSYVDVALDPDWDNVVRITGPAMATVRSIFPTDIRLEYGSIYSRLPNLPQHSTHEIQTPLAVAAVRGSEYLVTHNTTTEIFNFSASPVFVFGLTTDGDLLGNPSILQDNQMTGISAIGVRPDDQKVMTAEQLKSGLSMRKTIQSNSETAKETKVAKTEPLQQVQSQYMQDLKKRLNHRIQKAAPTGQPRQADYSNLLGSIRSPNRELENLVDKDRINNRQTRSDKNFSEKADAGSGNIPPEVSTIGASVGNSSSDLSATGSTISNALGNSVGNGIGNANGNSAGNSTDGGIGNSSGSGGGSPDLNITPVAERN